MVSCGQHEAPSCQECPGTNGQSWCNGDCKWNADTNSCEAKHQGNDVFDGDQLGDQPACTVDDSQCGYPWYKNDGFCDDDNNNCQCEWDGGDCCGDNVDTTFCDDCECLDPSH